MDKLLESLKEYLNNEIDPDALEYYEELKKYLKI